MSSYHRSSEYCQEILYPYYFPIHPSPELITVNLTKENIKSLWDACETVFELEVEGRYSEPMVWVGIYISIASLFCVLAMALDLLHGFRNRKFWFPNKYFSLNAASITVITVAMKLPVDLSSPMPGWVDQVAKMASSAFMCIMISNLMPSLASMDNKSLLANVIGLSILIITMIVNIFIQLRTGVIEHDDFSLNISNYTFNTPHFMMITYVYMVMLIFLLILLISSAITIPTSKKVLKFKYQAASKTALNDQRPQESQISIVEKLRQHVRRYWIMAETGSPQFVMAGNALSSAFGIICVISAVMYIFIVVQVTFRPFKIRCQSDYKWSMVAIVATQSIGVVVGAIAPISRCFTTLNFKSFAKWDSNHFAIFKVEKYWTQMLCEWKESHITFLSSSRRSRNLFQNLKNRILSFCIRFQKVIVVSCKMFGLIPIAGIFLVIRCSCYLKSLKTMAFMPQVASDSHNTDKDLRNYILVLEDNMAIGEKTLNGISNSMNRLIQRGEKEQPKNLLKLLEISINFEGVEKFDSDQVQSLLNVRLHNSWSLPIIVLTCIAISVPNIHKDMVDRLFKSVGEGLFYTHIVEENLNSASEYLNVQRAAKNLWREVEDKCKWLGNNLEKSTYEGKTSREILKLFAHTAKAIVIEVKENTNNGEPEPAENLPQKLLVANLMYRIAQTLMDTYQSNIVEISEDGLFTLITHMISDIFSACFTNLPRVITMKCQESAIEKREDSVVAAAKLLGRTTEIIKRSEKRELPNMDLDKMAFIDEWRHHLKQSIP